MACTAKGKKLLLNLLVLVLMDGMALPKRRSWYNESRLGRSLPIILEAVFTILFNHIFSFTVIAPNHTVIENVRTLSITAL